MINQKIVHGGSEYSLEFIDCDDFDVLDKSKVVQIYGVCFKGNKLVLGFNDSGNWSLLGGKPEQCEPYIDTLRREIKEESNMKLLDAKPIGYQYVKEEDVYQLRFACKVEPYGKFIKDPAGGITEIKLINPKDYKIYLKWGKIGDYLLEKSLSLQGNI